MHAQRHAAAAESDAFLLQPDPLREHAAHAGTPTDGALRIHDPMPGDIARTLSHGASHRPRPTREAGQRGELTVRHDVAGRHTTKEAVHGLVEAHAPSAPPWSSYRRA